MRSFQKIILITCVCAIAILMNGINSAQAGPGYGSYYANSPAGGVTGTALRKFVDSLPGICEVSGPNNLGQCLPLASAATLTVNGTPTDYYEIGLTEYTEKMHSDLPKATRLRGYYQINTSGTASVPHYLGPLIVATRDRPVTVKFVNSLPTGTAGNLFIPVDTSMMGAGTGPDGVNIYTQNRATLHLHGGANPWISDGTPHQWIVPALETSTTYTRGLSQQNVPGMPDPGAGAATFFWTNQQSGRLMFYHDHAYGITRLNVYAGEAAGYLLRDPAEEDALASAGVPGTLGTNPANWDLTHLVPLVIQDKTFVPQNIAIQDSKWDTTKWGQYGDLWFPHVYEANQDPNSPDGANPFGRWDYGPWFWPPVIVDAAHSVLPEPTTTPEAFMDTPIVNGTAYPYLDVLPTAYRFRILNACNDRTINLSLFLADPADPTGKDVRMVAAGPNPAFPADWPTDGRTGGVPDPATVGPSMIQIGSEGGILPNPVVIPNRPIGYDYNRRNIVVLNTLYRALMLGPAERADVIVDFSGLPAGTKVILYNDGPAPNPAYDTRYDYYTGDPDNSFQGGAPSTMVGYGPNIRTIMQFRVAGSPTAPFNPAQLNATLPAQFKIHQPTPIVPETIFNTVGYTNPPVNDLYSKISDYSLTFYPMDTSITGYTTVPATIQFQSKAIQELWDPWGRMNATLGVELPFTTNINQTTIPMGYVEPATEYVVDGQPQIWKITHNGVDTHPVHVHLFNAQLINRVGWDGAIRPPDDNELGWKETIRMNPLEDVIIALQPISQTLPFSLPTSTRPLDVTQSTSGTVATTDTTVTPPVAINVPNADTDFGFEYVWHCHILGHEENDFMRPMVFRVPTAVPAAPSGLSASNGGPGTGYGTNQVVLSWTDNANNQAYYRIERNGAPIGTITLLPNYTPTYVDSMVDSNATYTYQVFAVNRLGAVASALTPTTTNTFANAVSVTLSANKPTPHPMGTNVLFTAVATGPTASMVYKYRFSLGSGGTSTVQQNYSTMPSWALSAATPTGVYTITVDAKSGLTSSVVSTFMTYSVIVPPPPVVTVDPTTLPGIWTGPTVTVLMSTNVFANIYYTTDGTQPTTASTLYLASGITVTSTKTINYYAVDANGTPSVVGTGTWTIHSPDMVASMLINNGEISAHTTTVNLTLSAVDPSVCQAFPTGVQSMQFSNDGTTYTAEEPYATTKVWSLVAGLPDGPRTVYVRFRDCSLPLTPPPGGTLYSAITASITLDRLTPLTTASPPPGFYSGPTVTITLTPSKPANIYYTTDSSTPTTTSTLYVAPLVTSVTTTLKYFAVDPAGNVETTIKTGTWRVHTPDMVSSVNINNGAAQTNSVNVQLTLSATDPAGVATMQFSNDGVSYSSEETYTTTKAWSLTSGDGPKTVYARFRDMTLPGGVQEAPAVANIRLDTTPPVTTTNPVPGTYTTLPLSVILASNETATIYYTTDGSTPTTASAPYGAAIPIPQATPTTIKYFAVDLAGNSEAVHTGIWNALPNLNSIVKINNGAAQTNNVIVALTLAAADPTGVSTMQFSNDGTTYTSEETYTTSKTWTLASGDGLKTVYVRFRDTMLPAGAQLLTAAANIVLDTTPPVTTPNPVAGTYTTLPLSVTLTSNETATIYYTTDGTTPTTASAQYVSTAPISIPIASPTTIRYFSVDQAGNSEAVNTAIWTALPSGNLGYGGTVSDALRALMIAQGLITPTAADMMNGDVAPLIGGTPHPDGKIDLGDVIVLLRKAVGLVTW